MKIIKIGIGLCLLLSFAACSRESSNPQKDIVGTWKGNDYPSIALLGINPDGTFLMKSSFGAPSDFYTGRYTLNTDSSVNTLVLKLHGNGTLSFQPDKTVPYEVKVYENELVLIVGQKQVHLKRASN